MVNCIASLKASTIVPKQSFNIYIILNSYTGSATTNDRKHQYLPEGEAYVQQQGAGLGEKSDLREVEAQ